MTSPRHQVEAAIARLKKEYNDADKWWSAACDGGDQDHEMHAHGEMSAYQQSIQILRAECAGILRGDET